MYCNEPATRLCDAVIALVDGGWVKPRGATPYKVTTMEAMLSTSYTCEAPFCATHGKVVGFICGKDGDTIDYCAGCIAAERGRFERILTPGAIAALRRQRHAEYRRQRILLANTVLIGSRNESD